MIQAILFDFNGVIIDDERVQMKAYQDVFSEKGIELTEKAYFECLGMSDPVFVKTIFENNGKTPTAEDISSATSEKTRKWKAAVDVSIPLFDGIEDFIRRMRNHFTIGVVSMACREEIDHILNATGLAECFDTVVSSEDVTTTKPDPACYREGFKRIDIAGVANGKNAITRRQCVVIEDSPAGVISAKRARLKALGVTNTVDRGQLHEAGADAVTSNINDWNADSIRRVF